MGKKYKFNFGGGRNNSSGVYFLAFIGAAVYFVGHSRDFWGGVLGILKAIVWPAFAVFAGLHALHV